MEAYGGCFLDSLRQRNIQAALSEGVPCVCVHILHDTYIHIYIHAYISTYMNTYMRTCLRAFMLPA